MFSWLKGKITYSVSHIVSGYEFKLYYVPIALLHFE